MTSTKAWEDVDTYSTPTLPKLLASNQSDAARLITHHFDLNQIEEAYDIFFRAGETGALEVVLTQGR